MPTATVMAQSVRVRGAGRGCTEQGVDTRGGGADCLLLVRAGAGSPTRCCCCCSRAKAELLSLVASGGWSWTFAVDTEMGYAARAEQLTGDPQKQQSAGRELAFPLLFDLAALREVSVPELCQHLRFVNRNFKPGSPRSSSRPT